MFRLIKTKLLTAQISLVLFISVVVGLTAYFLMHHFLRKSQQQNLTFVAESVGRQLDLTIRDREKMLEKIAVGEAVSAYSKKYQEPVLLKYFAGFVSDFGELVYVNKDGLEELKAVDGQRQENLSDISKSVLYEEASWKPNKTVGFLSDGNGNVSTACMEFAFYRRNFFDEFEGMVVGRIPITEFFKNVREFRFGEQGFAVVVNMKGFILAHPDSDKILKQMAAGDSKLREALCAGEVMESSFCRAEVFGVDSYIAFSPVAREDWIVVAILPYQEFMVAPAALRNISILVSLVILIIASLMSYFLAAKLSRPILELTNKAQLVSQGDLSQRVEIKSNDEIGYLCDSFNCMIENLNESTTSIDNLNSEIAERKKAEGKQAELLEQVESVNQELTDFAYIVSHDLKAPLRGIKSIIGFLVSDYAEKFDEEGRKQLELLVSRVDRLQALIEGVLNYSRLGRVEEESEAVDLNRVLPEVIDLIAPPENISITVENEMPVIMCERTRIFQVFQNLLSNAVKYMDKPDGRIQVGCVKEAEFWKFSVADNGLGIEEKHFEQIFKVFQTLNRRDEVEGTGIGLSVVKKIVGTYGGSTWVESEVGKGSTFSFTLPLHLQATEDAMTESGAKA